MAGQAPFGWAPPGQLNGSPGPPPIKTVSFHPDAGGGPGPGGIKTFAKSGVFATRKWLAVTPQGELLQLELAKMRVTHTLGVQLRDLRLLDPKLAASYPSAILARERAIVINLEFIKAIISQESIFVTNLEDPNTIAFVDELQRRLQAPPGGSFGSLSAPSSPSLAGGSEAGARGAEEQPPGLARLSAINMAAPENLPFELRVLEVALETVARYVEQTASDLELAAHPALDALTSQINTSNLERVRRIKNRMVRLTRRVETLREVLEKFLDDDSDMKDLNLTAKEEDRSQQWERRAGDALPFDALLTEGGAQESLPTTPRPTSSLPRWVDGLPTTPRPVGGSISSASSASSDAGDDPAVTVVEMVMEPYFMQIDNTYNKLQTLCEYIDDTEDYINIELDSHRNALIRLDVVLTSFSASVALVTAITGLFAMNIMMQPDKEGQAPYSWFVAVASSTGAGAMLLFLGLLAYCRWQRLI